MNAEMLKRLIRAISDGTRETRLANELVLVLIQQRDSNTQPKLHICRSFHWHSVTKAFVGLSAAQLAKIPQTTAKSAVLANQESIKERHLRDTLAGGIE